MRASIIFAAACLAATAANAGGQLVKKTYVYKTVGDCPIEADVYRADNDKVQPVVVWLQGGSLIIGSRHGAHGGLRNLCRKEEYILVSLDYRLAPEAKLPAIIEDIRDGFTWIRQKGPKLFHADPNKILVAGGSAGGYLTMMTGIAIEPRPTALLAYWGYGGFEAPWAKRPSPHHGKPDSLLPKAEMLKSVGGKVLTGSSGKTVEFKRRVSYYRMCRQTGTWAREVTGLDPDTQADKLRPYCPVRNITPAYPPILMIHGTADTDVPYEESAAMARELARHKVPHELITIPNGGHGLGGGDKKLIAEAHARALEFVKEQLK